MLDTRLLCSTEKVKLFAGPETYKDTNYKHIRVDLETKSLRKYLQKFMIYPIK